MTRKSFLSLILSQKNTDDDVVRITTNLVQIDAIVTKDGKLVSDLKAEDFEIFEDGKKQTITSFSYISNLPATSPAVTNSADRDKSDASYASSLTSRFNRTISWRSFVPAHNSALQQFTNDKRLLNRAVDQLRWNALQPHRHQRPASHTTDNGSGHDGAAPGESMGRLRNR